MKLLIKLGGALLEHAGLRQSLAVQLAEAAREHTLVVVHGGGKQVTEFLTERGIASHFSGGLRVSDEFVIDAVTKVICGSINQQLVGSLLAAGLNAVGLSGVDGGLTIAEQLRPELGFVGQPTRTDPRLLNLLTSAGYTPAVACVAGDRAGNIYNVNADRMAVSCAAGWGADRLLFLTDVPGVKNAAGEVAPVLTISDARSLIEQGVATGGMQAKLEAAETAILQGVGKVVIASGHEPQICDRLLRDEPAGTALVPDRTAGIASPSNLDRAASR